MTLLELVVSLSLAAGLLGSIFYWVWSQNRLNQEMAAFREKILDQEYLMIELQDSLARMCMRPVLDKEPRLSGFTLEDKKLHFYFKSHVHPIAEMNLIQKATLYLEGENLMLETAPCPELWPQEKVQAAIQKKKLAKGVHGLHFYFLYLPSVDPGKQKSQKQDLLNEGKDWSMGLVQLTEEDRLDLPVAVVLGLTQGKSLYHVAIWREDGELVHALERSGS